ncbi:DUF3526 domain-containing protein [Aliikangiella coralliicola]|uniref:DUF3526 domain-containing protein n=1 Tax=Aliikangiella coralliicola TaxID=2592383 RepID=A0A545UGI0_9GAMM|nr:DUF3526 domain-containing protein [Aliikangiella coralliicola]TQV88584.1 DUF3526 domain-containing protein [Aliikangiella coralliicola]
MNNILTVFRHEWRQKSKEKLLTLMFIISQGLMFTALISGWSQHMQTQEKQAKAQEIVEHQWNSQPDRHPHRVAHFGHFTFRPPSALSFFDIGVNNFVGNSIFIEAHRQNSANFANDQGSGTLLRFSEMSVANLMLTFWPLLLIAMAFGTIAAEKKGGTLKLLLSVDVSITQLLTGKGLCYLVISLLFILPVFIATLALLLFADVTYASDTLIRVGLLAVIYIMYSVFWIACILLVSSLTNLPRYALGILISLWFVLVIISPRLLADIAAEQFPQLSRNAFDREIKEQVSQIGNSHNPDDPHFNEFKAKTLQRYGVKTVEELPVNYRALVIQEGERISSEIYSKLYKASILQQEKQFLFVSNFYWINPYLLFRDLSMAVSGSNIKHFYDYELQSEQHRFNRITKLNQIHAEHIDYHQDRGSKAHHDMWSKFQAFHYQAPNLVVSVKPFTSFWPIPLVIIGIVIFTARSRPIKRRLYAWS